MNVLENAWNDPEVFEQADKMYSASFRYAEVMIAGEEYPIVPAYYDNDGYLVESGFENEADRNKWFKGTFGVVFDPSLEIVEVCNYKGEGEDYALLSMAKNYPIFTSKCDSYFSV